MEILAPRVAEGLACLDRDLLQGLEAIGREPGAGHVHALHPLGREGAQRIHRIRLDPFRRPESRLERDHRACIHPAELGSDQPRALEALDLVGVAAVHARLGDAVEAQHELVRPPVLEPVLVDVLRDGLRIAPVVVEILHEADLRRRPQLAQCLLQRVLHRARGAPRVLRVHRDHQDPPAPLGLQLREALRNRRLAVAHRRDHRHHRLVALPEISAQELCLPLVVDPERRAVGLPDAFVLASGLGRAKRQDEQVEDRQPQPSRQLDHARIGEELAQVVAHGGSRRRIGRSEVHEQHAGVGGRLRVRRHHAVLGKRGGDELRGHVHDRDHALVGHARGADHAHGADDLAVDLVGRGDDRALVQRHEVRLAADEDLHALGALAVLEKLEELRLALEEVEEPAQPLHVRREVVHLEQVSPPGNHHLVVRADRFAPGLDRRAHQRRDVLMQLDQLGLHLGADLLELQACVMLVQVVGGLDQLRRRVRAIGDEDAVLHVAVARHDDEQHAPLGKPEELDVAQHRAAPPGCDDHAREMREIRKDLGGRHHHAMRVIGEELLFELLAFVLLDGPDREERIDEKAIGLGRGYAAGGGVGTGHEPHLLEIRHDVADGGRGELQLRHARERARSDGLPFGDVALDQYLQQVLSAIVQHGTYSTIAAMPTAFKTVALVGKSDAASLPDVLDQLVALLRRRGHAVLMDPLTAGAVSAPPDDTVPLEELAARANLAVVVGGDGTLLASARLMAVHGVPLVGVNLGRLGFLTDIAAKDLVPSMEAVLDGEYTEEERMLLSGAARRGLDTLLSAVALNAVVVSRGAMGAMIEFAVTVDDEFLYTLRADGVIVATPTGSTAYALSAGGPILHPALPALTLVPLNPHTLSARPVTISDRCAIEIKLVHALDARAHFDGLALADMAEGDRLLLKRSADVVRFVHPPGYRYFATLRQKLRWSETLEKRRASD